MRIRNIMIWATLAGTLSVFGVLQATSRNIAPDAISRATTWNTHEGDIQWITDGRVPPGDATAFVWPSKGILVFEWDTVHRLDQVRIRLGEADSDFTLMTYIGGKLLDDGASRSPNGELTARLVDDSGASHQWIVMELPAGTYADNLELETRGSTEIYEIEVLAEGTATTVQGATWSRVKMLHTEQTP